MFRPRATRGVPVPSWRIGAPRGWSLGWSPGWSLDPSGPWLSRWMGVMVLPLLYNWVGGVCRACFPGVRQGLGVLWGALDVLADGLYLLDMVVGMHTGFLEQGVLIRDPVRLRRRYLRSRSFLLDLAAVVPTELLLLCWGGSRGGAGVPLARANRCLKVRRALGAAGRWETRSGRPNAVRAATLVLQVLVGIHTYGCLYFALSAHLGLGSDPWVCPNASRPGFGRPLRQYLYSLHFATLVLATVGDTPAPRRPEEFLFVTLGFLLAVLGFATVAGSVSSVISNLDAADAAFYPDPEPARRFLRARGAGGRLEKKVARWYRHLRAQRKLPAEREVLRHLPEGLMAEVVADVHLPALRRVGLFQGCPGPLLRSLVLRLRPRVYGPGEFVCRRGDVGREMFFIREGRLAVVAEDGVTRLALLGEGLYFGEISIINIKGNTSGNRRTANILSIGYSDLFCLSKEDLGEVLAQFPSARAAMEAKGRDLLLQMGKLDPGAEAAAAAAEEGARGLEVALGGLQTRAARLLAQLEATALQMEMRVGRLEGRMGKRGGAAQGGEGAGERGAPRGHGPPRAQGPPGTQEPLVAWGAIEPRGPPKTQGPPGPQGPSKTHEHPKTQGPPKPEVPTKFQGPPKPQGPLKPQGPTKTRDPPIAQGLDGVQGPPRGQGPTVSQGPLEIQDPPRPQGPPRSWGLRGAQGPTRSRGLPTSQGPRRAQGPSKYQGPPTSWGRPRAQGPPKYQGPPMAQGPPKSQGPRGAQPPPMAQGAPMSRPPSMSQGHGGGRGAGGPHPRR